jgi:hypothetical protein
MLLKFKNMKWEFLVRQGKTNIAWFMGFRRRNASPGFHLKVKITVSLMNIEGSEPDEIHSKGSLL